MLLRNRFHASEVQPAETCTALHVSTPPHLHYLAQAKLRLGNGDIPLSETKCNSNLLLDSQLSGHSAVNTSRESESGPAIAFHLCTKCEHSPMQKRTLSDLCAPTKAHACAGCMRVVGEAGDCARELTPCRVQHYTRAAARAAGQLRIGANAQATWHRRRGYGVQIASITSTELKSSSAPSEAIYELMRAPRAVAAGGCACAPLLPSHVRALEAPRPALTPATHNRRPSEAQNLHSAGMLGHCASEEEHCAASQL